MRNNQSKLKALIPAFLICIFFLSPAALPTISPALRIYDIGTKILVHIGHFGLSADGNMKVLEKSQFNEKDVILIRSEITELGGLMGFIVKFLRIYKGSNTFDTYIDLHNLKTVRYENYKLKKDNTREINEHIYFDRKRNTIVSLMENKVILRDVSSDIQDVFSAFLNFVYRFNTEELYVGKKLKANLYGYEEAYTVEIDVVKLENRDNKTVYIMEIKELPSVFKYPASIIFEVVDIGGEFWFPVRGECEIHIRFFPDVTIKAELEAMIKDN
jgi:hypothetical protein